MQVLCLSDAEPSTVLPGLELLSHEVRTSPLGVRLTSNLARRFDLLLVDGTEDVRRAKRVCLELKAECPTPRLLVVTDSALPAVTPEWEIADLLLPAAGPAEIDLRMRLAARAGRDNLDADEPTELSAGGVVIDEANFTARVHGRTLDLTYKEYELLHFLTANSARVFTREKLLDEVWGGDYFGGIRTVDVHIRRLRAKLGDHEALISTVRGVGYGFARAELSAETADPSDEDPSAGNQSNEEDR